MRKTVPLKNIFLYLIAGLMTLGLALTTAYPCYASGAHAGKIGRSSCKDTIYTILVNKSQGCKKYNIRLYPDAKRQVLFFSAGGADKKIYQLYMFDMDGKLVSQATIRNRETTILTNITEGNYLYEVFSNDERIENGQVTVK